MKNIKEIIYRLIPRWLKEYIYDRMSSEYQDQELLSHWYKARRAVWKRKDLGYYLADIANNKNMDLVGKIF